MNRFLLWVTGLIAAAFATAAMPRAYNDAATMESLQNRLIELNEQANNIQARADAEKRDLNTEERKEIESIFAAFEDVEAEIERRAKLDELNAKIKAPGQRRTEPAALPGDDDDDDAGAGTQNAARAAQRQQSRQYAQPRQTDAGKWGFRSAGEYLAAVVKASQRGAQPDPRLIANAPTTYGQEGVGADGGFAVPPDFRSTIVMKLTGEEALLSRTDQMTSSSNTMTVPVDETAVWDSTGGIQASWESEAGQKGQSKPLLKEVSVKLNKLVALVPLTDELLEDAPAMAGYVNNKAPEKINWKVNQAIINGTGAGQPLGILQSGGLVTVTAESGQAADTVVFNNIVNMYSRLYAPAKGRAVWLINSDIEPQLMKMQFPGTGTAVPVYLPPGGLAGAPFATLMGRPVIASEAMPALGDAGDIILADMSQYLSIVKGGGVRQDVSIHLWFDYDVTAFRFVLRVGGQPWWNNVITRTGGQPTRGFFIALGAR